MGFVQTHFMAGFVGWRLFADEKVTPEERDRRMHETFHRLAPYYEQLLDVQNLELFRYWRRLFKLGGWFLLSGSFPSMEARAPDVSHLLWKLP